MRAILDLFPNPGGVIRVYHDDNAVLGSPYFWACAVERVAPAVLSFHGAVGTVTGDIMRALNACLRREGYTAGEWERFKNGIFVRRIRMPVRGE